MPAAQGPRIALAGLLYVLAVIGVGFVLGPIRMFWLEPLMGPAWATASESPFLIAAMIGSAHWAPRIARVDVTTAALGLVGLVALVLSQIAEFAGGIVLRGLSVSEQIARFGTSAGMIYAALLALFALMPLLVNHKRT